MAPLNLSYLTVMFGNVIIMWGPVGVHLSSKEQKKKMLLPAPVILTTRAWCQRHIALPPARRSTCARHRPATATSAPTWPGIPHRDSGRAARLHLSVPHHRPRPAPAATHRSCSTPTAGRRSVPRLPPPRGVPRLRQGNRPPDPGAPIVPASPAWPRRPPTTISVSRCSRPAKELEVDGLQPPPQASTACCDAGSFP